MKTAEARQNKAVKTARYARDSFFPGASGERTTFVPVPDIFGAAALVEGAQENFWTPAGDEASRKRYITSVSLHVLLIGAIYAASLNLVPPPVQETPIELVMEQAPTPPPPPTPVKAEEPPPPPPPAKDEEAIAPVKPKPPKPKPVKVVKQVAKPSPAASPAPQIAQTRTAPVAAPANTPPRALPSAYVARVYQKVSHTASGSYPKSALARELEGRVSYTLVLDGNGGLLRYTVEPSGKEVFDKAAAAAIEKAAPYPAPPDLGANAYQLHGVIAYELSNE